MILAAWVQDHAQLLLIVLVSVSAFVGLATALAGDPPHRRIGRGWLDASDGGPDDPNAEQRERLEDIRQMLEARAARRGAESSLEIETELILLDALATAQGAYPPPPRAGSALVAAPTSQGDDNKSLSPANGDYAACERASQSPVASPRAYVSDSSVVGHRRHYCPLRRVAFTRKQTVCKRSTPC
jgi:hypothetical protein